MRNIRLYIAMRVHVMRAFFLIAIVVFGASSTANAAEIVVSAAASLSDAFRAIGKAFEKSHTGTTVTFNFAASDVLLAQIAKGAPADVFAAADDVSMDPNVEVPGEPKHGEEVPDFHLTNQDGSGIHLAQYRGKTLVLTFIYTRCPLPDYCPLMSENFRQIDMGLAKDPSLYSKTHLLSISFDTDYDAPKVLRSYGAGVTGRFANEKFEHWEFATGTSDEIKGITQYFSLQYYHNTESGQDQMIHALRTAIIDSNGRFVKMYRGNQWKPDEILKEVQTLASQ